MQETWVQSLGWEGKSYPLQYSGLENSIDFTVHGVAKSWRRLSDFHFHKLHSNPGTCLVANAQDLEAVQKKKQLSTHDREFMARISEVPVHHSNDLAMTFLLSKYLNVIGRSCASLMAQWWRICLSVRETLAQSQGRKDPLEKEMATHASILAWKIPWTEKPGRLQSMGSQRVGHNWATSLYLVT